MTDYGTSLLAFFGFRLRSGLRVQRQLRSASEADHTGSYSTASISGSGGMRGSGAGGAFTIGQGLRFAANWGGGSDWVVAHSRPCAIPGSQTACEALHASACRLRHVPLVSRLFSEACRDPCLWPELSVLHHQFSTEACWRSFLRWLAFRAPGLQSFEINGPARFAVMKRCPSLPLSAGSTQLLRLSAATWI